MTAALADPAVTAARRASLDRPHMAALRDFAQSIRAAHGPTPDFDPADGGMAAQVLLLLETPGPAVGHGGFVSMDNPTGTARNLRRFLAQAGLDRGRLVIWNAVPWLIHQGGRNRAPRVSEIREGLACLPPLLGLLPGLRCAVLAGRAAGMAELGTLPTVRVPHPSPTYVCTAPDIATRIVGGFAQAASLATGRSSASAAGR